MIEFYVRGKLVLRLEAAIVPSAGSTVALDGGIFRVLAVSYSYLNNSAVAQVDMTEVRW